MYGSQDIFLTGAPEITFFKVLYRRHTNFAVESILQNFLGEMNFGLEGSSIISKVGDLMSRVYLEIELPRVNLLKNRSNWSLNQVNAKRDFDIVQEYYQLVKCYVKSNLDVVRQLISLLRANNVKFADVENMLYNEKFFDQLVLDRAKLQKYIISNENFSLVHGPNVRRTDVIQVVNRTDVQGILRLMLTRNRTNVDDVARRRKLFKSIAFLYDELRSYYLEVYQKYLEKQRIYQSFLDKTYTERYKFAWVEELGHVIIETLEIKIGNQLMDRHTGDWFILFNKLFLQEYQSKNYQKMIGNVPLLTNFDDMVKEPYKLIVPFQFWFCRHTGLSLPLVSLRYHDVVFNLKIRELSKLCYFENISDIPNVASLQTQYNINLGGVHLYIDYIFLDGDERRRFAQSSHEYLIEIIQYNEFVDISGNQYTAHLTFTQPTKFVVWFLQPNQYRENPVGTRKCQWNNYGINLDKSGYTLKTAVLRLNSYDRTDPYLDIKYFNYLQPYLHFRNSPTDGLYVYSFALKPMEYQPSGSINLSRINDFSIQMVFSQELVDLVEQNSSSIYIGVYAMSYNILRIMSGMGGLAFQTAF
ncbi:MAG: major capsid protein [Thermoplasmata archaeon]